MTPRMRSSIQFYLSLSGQRFEITSLNPQVIVPHTLGLRGDLYPAFNQHGFFSSKVSIRDKIYLL